MFRAVFLLLALAFSAFAEDHALVKSTDFWRVQPFTTNNPVEPKEGWTQADYDDSTWMNLQASFLTSWNGTPGGAEQTFLPQNTLTYCFRKTFKIDDPSFVKWLALRIDYESGFVAYLNGNEIVRRGFPPSTSPVPLGAVANVHARGLPELIDISSASAYLQPGTNVLAIQLHSAADDLPSMYLVTELTANFTRGPFIENMTTNSVQVIWRTVAPSTGSVEYGKDAEHLSLSVDDSVNTNHVATLAGLEPNQEYIYRVYVQNSQVATSDWSHFHTFKMPGAPVQFVVVGDTGQASAGQYNIADQMNSQPVDLVMHVGDIVYFCFADAHADARCFSIYRDQMATTPFFFCLGNHDSYCGRADYLRDFYQPTNSVTGNSIWYSFDDGDAHFIVLDTDRQQGQSYDPGSPEYTWLEADLATTRQPWKFIFFHHVFRSSSFHSLYDDFDLNHTLDKFQLQAHIGGLASLYGAQVIFNGHDHDYERFAASNGINSFVAGGGGASLYDQYFNEEGSAQYYTRYSFLRVTVDGPEMKVEAVDQNGVVFDRLYRAQTGSGSGPFSSKWESPTVESASGSDVAGNIPGQTFNFTGDSIRTFAGKRANLGRVHVRNDQSFLYIGFEDASIWNDQAIALFVENPDQPGITNLAALGNGVVDDATGEGVDGLDLITNLNFRNFHPSVACLLGDEKADSTQRNFRRTNMVWAAGQGVFHLDQTFSSVPEARLQQFNRSPQTAVPTYFDANADFIEVAVPLYEIGNPQYQGGHSQVKLGAIAFSAPLGGSITPQIDTAFAGNALDTNADGTFTLEPFTIQLAPDPNPFHDMFAFTATIQSDTKLHFQWNSIAGAVYTIQSAAALGQPFEDLNVPGLPLSATASRSSFDLIIDGSSPRFYRLRAN